MRLAQAELAEKGRHAGKGAGMFGGAGLVALYGVGALVTAAILGLATVLEPWIAAAAIGVVLLVSGRRARAHRQEGARRDGRRRSRSWRLRACSATWRP